jgi:pimeloyl-ACP methyl ester carboxylesterase
MRKLIVFVSALLVFFGLPAFSAAVTPTVLYRTVEVRGLKIFYREAGPPNAPVILLLHGFPSSSFMFRDLIPELAGEYHVIAPDYPGFGQSSFPDRKTFDYTFANLTNVIDGFLTVLKIDRYALYIQDYGSPLGLRLALLHPERVSALIVQNGNAYEEGLSAAWDPLRVFWQDPTPERREAVRGWLNAAGVRYQYLAGTPATQQNAFSPDTWTLDWALLNRPGNIDAQLDLLYDYRTNVALYPEFQRFLRERRPPILIVWGKFDPFFTVEGARAYQRDVPAAEVRFFDTGHFALETHAPEIGRLMREFLKKKAHQRRSTM